jgi:3D (Asp-Asp-Asp) domain-containing protein
MRRHHKEAFTAFAYSAGGKTALGKAPTAGQTVAADPGVLPLGSRVRISGAGSYSGEYQVGDVGPAVKGNKIDIFVASRAEAIEFGRRTVIVTVLDTPQSKPEAESSRAKRAPEAIIALDEARRSSTYPSGTN